MIRVFTKECLPKTKRSSKNQHKNIDNPEKTDNVRNVEEGIRFDKWFASSYTKLREKIRFFSMVDEDNFHNTYLFVREKAMCCEERIENFEAYFFRCYRYKAMTAMKEEGRYIHPEDDFFLRFAEEESDVSFGKLTRCEKLAKDVLRYIRSRFSNQEYRMFMLRYYSSQCSLKVLSEYTGLPLTEVMRKTKRMLESLRSNSYFVERCEMLYVYE